ncbi:MAG: DUF4158 domain-containing protein [Ruminiclostridium sp.]
MLKKQRTLTEEQRQDLKQIPSDLNTREMAAYYPFSQHDIEIISRHRRSHNSLGFTVQLSVLQYPGWPLTEIDSISYNVLEYNSRQIDSSPDDFSLFLNKRRLFFNPIW